MSETIRVILADDHAVVLQGLRGLLEQEEDIQVLALVQNGDEVLECLEKSEADVVVLDLEMPYHGLTALEEIRKREFPVRVVGYDVNRVLWLGRQVERTVGHRLRSEAVINGRTLKEGHPKFARPGLKKLKENLGEKPGQKVPADWGEKAKLPEKYRQKERYAKGIEHGAERLIQG